MTHTLHRRGTIESLNKDYVVLVMATAGINDADAKTKLRNAYEKYLMASHHLPLKLGKIWCLPLRLVLKFAHTRVHRYLLQLVFNDNKVLTSYLKELKESNIGLSVTVSGLFDKVNDCLKKIDLRPHTVQFSLGTFGKTEALPKDEILDTTTMCGHHMVSSGLVRKLANDVAKGEITPEEAGRIMARQCVCGVFNKARASELIKALAKQR